QKQAGYPNGTVLQMTGRCTGGINLLDIANQPAWKQAQKIRYRWCEVWHDPVQNGNFVTGWAYGKYIIPH
ncbi:SH3 domain-containing protein, partial [Mesorhizobium sp. M7A.F.Ca.CA.001.08.1.1]